VSEKDLEERVEALEKKAGIPKKTHVLFVLDRSSSMNSRREETISTFNEQIKTLVEKRTQMGEVTASLVLFNQHVTEVQFGVHLDEVKPLDLSSYAPSGYTALRDGVGQTIKKALAELDDGGDDTAFLLIIITDGEENTSTMTPEAFKSLMDEAKATKRWTIDILGCDVDLTVAKSVGLGVANFKQYGVTKRAARGMSGNLSRGIGAYAGSREQVMACSMNLESTSTEDFPDDAPDAPADNVPPDTTPKAEDDTDDDSKE